MLALIFLQKFNFLLPCSNDVLKINSVTLKNVNFFMVWLLFLSLVNFNNQLQTVASIRQFKEALINLSRNSKFKNKHFFAKI